MLFPSKKNLWKSTGVIKNVNRFKEHEIYGVRSIRYPVLSLIPSFSLPDVLCDPTDLILRKGTPFEAMTGRTAPSSDGLLAEVFWGFPRL